MFKRISKKQQDKANESVAKEIEKQQIEEFKKQIRRGEQPAKAVVQNIKQIKPTPVDFSWEQEALRGIFGHGSKIWALEDSGTQVQLNRTLYSGETETGALFGMSKAQNHDDKKPKNPLF